MSLIFYYIVAHSPGVVGIHGLRKGRKVVGLPCDFFFSLFVVQKIFFKPATLPSSSTPQKMAGNQAIQVEEILKDLQNTPGFKAYIILNSDGIVIRHTMDSNERAVQHAHHITELYNKSVAQIQDLFDHPEDSRVENVRMRTKNHEMIVSSVGSYTLAVFQDETA